MEEAAALAQAAGIPLPQERVPLLAASLPLVRRAMEALSSLPLGEGEGPAGVFRAPEEGP